MPVAQRLGCTEQLGTVGTVLEAGASYQRQRAVAAEHDGDLSAVVDALLAEFSARVPRPVGPSA